MKLWLVPILVFILSACSEPAHIELNRDAKVLAFGDSLTVSVGAKHSSYPKELAQLTGLEVIASGVSGEQTHQGLARLRETLTEHQPGVLVLLEGGNDFLRNKQSHSVKSNLAAMIELAHGQGVEVILVAVPQKSLFLSDAPLYQELAEQYQVALVADTLSDLLGDSQYKSDQIHLNDKGYRLLAEAVAEQIKVVN
ncbi:MULTISPECIES: GDSL-type esterase/lipase family protein [unclassified Pseudoalteromonas]|uniref:GDSL-type esterase/lipase family protein n=1 Tax=unclassified Pseudoalteromonas TaxID=194690 RepID=UPI000CF6D021|nr:MULTISPECIES: GDSL-type esterase/lipase family protein [unclassified Pseudoalteromonas]MBS3797683.1 arylesterase [Pseudoalteromonas sp. BDTF-M6]